MFQVIKDLFQPSERAQDCLRRIGELNAQPPSPERDREILSLISRLSRLDKSYSDKPAYRGPNIYPMRFGGEEGPHRKPFADARVDRIHELTIAYKILTNGSPPGDSALIWWPWMQSLIGLDEFQKVSKGIEISTERNRLWDEVQAERRQKRDDQAEQLHAELQAISGEERALQAQLDAELAKLAPLAAQLELVKTRRAQLAGRAWDMCLRHDWRPGLKFPGCNIDEDPPGNQLIKRAEALRNAAARGGEP